MFTSEETNTIPEAFLYLAKSFLGYHSQRGVSFLPPFHSYSDQAAVRQAHGSSPSFSLLSVLFLYRMEP